MAKDKWALSLAIANEHILSHLWFGVMTLVVLVTYFYCLLGTFCGCLQYSHEDDVNVNTTDVDICSLQSCCYYLNNLVLVITASFISVSQELSSIELNRHNPHSVIIQCYYFNQIYMLFIINIRRNLEIFRQGDVAYARNYLITACQHCSVYF